MTTSQTIYCSVLSIGSEILDGRILDTNARYILADAKKNGFTPGQILSCDDKVEDICRALTFLTTQSSVVVISGGLGPTDDNLTRQAIAKFSSSELLLDDSALNRMKEKFARRNRPFPAINERQAFFPKNSQIVANPVGSAEGFAIDYKEGGRAVKIFSLPGVPKELQRMWEETVLPEICKAYPERSQLFSKQMRLFGLSEAEVGLRIEQLDLSKLLSISYRPVFPEIQLQVTSNNQIQVNEAHQKIIDGIGEEYFFSKDGTESLPQTVHTLLKKSGKTLSAAESCTGGLLSQLLCENEGASSYFLGSIVSYSNAAKENFLAVPKDLLEKYGAVSAEVAEAMARGAQKKFHSDFALSITGVAGPSGGSEEKPVGTFYVGFATPERVESNYLLYPQERNMVQRYAAFIALERLRRVVL